MKRPAQALLWFILLVGIALRVAGENHPLWLDEIWSCNIASQLSSPAGVLTEPPARVDNNHPLNTFWLGVLGNHQPYWLYHVPSMLAGIGTLLATSIVARRRSVAAALWAVALAAVSLPLIQFSDEARGYALAAFFGVLMFDQVERFLERGCTRHAGLFFLFCILGGLSHVLILHVYVGLAAMSALALWKRRAVVSPLHQFALLHAGPILFWLSYYVLFVGRLKFGGGAPRWFLFQSVCDALAGLGGWIGPLSVLPALGLSAAIVALAVALCRRQDPAWLFVVIGCFLSPIVLIAPQWILSDSPVPMASRYFLPLLPIVIVLFGDALARQPRLQWLAAIILLLNLVNSTRFIIIGPGDGAAVLRTIAAIDPHADVLVDHPLRTKMVLDFYAQRLALGQSISISELTNQDSIDQSHANWFVVHGRGVAAPRGIELGSGRPLRLFSQIPAFGLSGYDFAIYRRVD